MLKLPPPLDRDLTIQSDGESASLMDGETVIASAVRKPIAIDVPDPPSLEVASAAEQRFTGLSGHIFPCCFVCGPDRAEGDGLRIFPGALENSSGHVAAAWAPDPSLLKKDGSLRPEFVWAALDCPGYFAVENVARPAVLGRLGVHMFETRVESGPLIVSGWPILSDGRKHEAGTALHDRDGRLIAVGHATWITLRK